MTRVSDRVILQVRLLQRGSAPVFVHGVAGPHRKFLPALHASAFSMGAHVHPLLRICTAVALRCWRLLNRRIPGCAGAHALARCAGRQQTRIQACLAPKPLAAGLQVWQMAENIYDVDH